jgi:hypothetical protein
MAKTVGGKYLTAIVMLIARTSAPEFRCTCVAPFLTRGRNPSQVFGNVLRCCDNRHTVCTICMYSLCDQDDSVFHISSTRKYTQ